MKSAGSDERGAIVKRFGITAVCVLVGIVLPGAARGEVPAMVPVILDDFESLEQSRTIWGMGAVTVEPATEHATSGEHSLKITVPPKGGGLRGLKMSKAAPADWSPYRAIAFDVYNAGEHAVDFIIRIDDTESRDFKDRFEPCGQFWLPPKQATHVEIRLGDLQANNFRFMDTTKIAYFGFHLGGGPHTLYVDSVQLIPAPQEERPMTDWAEAPRVIDSAEDEATSKALWQASEAKVEIGVEHATEGKQSLQVTYPKGVPWPALKFENREQPLNWKGYKTFLFDVTNPGGKSVHLSLRIDDDQALDMNGRFMVNGLPVPPNATTTFKIDIRRMANRGGWRMHKDKITLIALFTGTLEEDVTVYVDNVRLGVEGGGRSNELLPGAVPGQSPASLAEKLLADPEIKPLIPVFEAMPAKRIAFLTHSVSMTEHFATSGGFCDIAAAAVRAVNSKFEYKGFHGGNMTAGAAIGMHLKNMEAYKPSELYVGLFVNPLSACWTIAERMNAAGCHVSFFDSVLPWIAYPSATAQAFRDYAAASDGTAFIELMPRSWGQPGSYKWRTNDDGHMMTVGHMFFAKELLKVWAERWNAEAAASAPPVGP